MTFSDAIKQFTLKVDAANKDVFANVVSAVQDSIVNGSAVTGAPGQPVDTGNLRASWQTEFESPTSALISTNVEYAPVIEDGVGKYGPLTLRSAVGGFHSAALTVAGFERLVEQVVADAKGATS